MKPEPRRLLAAATVAACLFPFGYLLLLSIAEDWRFPRLLPGGLAPERWLEGLTSSDLGHSFLISSVISLIVAAISAPVGFLASKFIAERRRPRPFLFLAYAPFVMSPAVISVCLMHLYLRLGLSGGVAGVIAAQTIFSLAFAIVFFHGFWNPRVKAMEDLVYTLGGTRRQAFREALLPAARGMLLICFFQAFLISWFQYALTVMIGAGKVQTLPLKVYDYVNEANPYFAAMAACLLALPPTLLLWFNKRYVFKQA